MSMHQDIKVQMVEAMKARDAVRLTTLRGLLAAFTNEAVAKGKKPDTELSDDEALAVISRQVKQRKDSIEQFEKGGRPELADAERAELAVLETYLPEQMPPEQVEKFVRDKFDKKKPDAKEKGKFMGEIMKELKGKADGGVVRAAVDRLFS